MFVCVCVSTSMFVCVCIRLSVNVCLVHQRVWRSRVLLGRMCVCAARQSILCES